jgi:hypothetical protein
MQGGNVLAGLISYAWGLHCALSPLILNEFLAASPQSLPYSSPSDKSSTITHFRASELFTPAGRNVSH